MICVVIKGPSLAEIDSQIQEALKYADLLEFRWDCFDSLNYKVSSPLPVIYTLRSKEDGGFFESSREESVEVLERLVREGRPQMIDLDHKFPQTMLDRFRGYLPGLKIIRSYHNFQETPADLDHLLASMGEVQADYYKISTMARSILDSLRMLIFLREHSQSAKVPIIGICMGKMGEITRCLQPLFSDTWTYGCAFEESQAAPGQLTGETLAQIYNFKSLNGATAIYGLIGDPVEKSLSHITHNEVMRLCGLNAVYVKMDVKEKELDSFLALARSLNFRGLSVTMPLKEAVIPQLESLDDSAEKVKAVNTLLFCKEEGDSIIKGFNTDGQGAIEAIEEVTRLDGARVVVLGAGGAAKAIAFEAKVRGADVLILNRSPDRALIVANEIGCRGESLEEMNRVYQEGYDILINCTPSEMPISAEYILPQSIVMDINTRPKESRLIQTSRERGCEVICGYKMFVRQAAMQFALWFQRESFEGGWIEKQCDRSQAARIIEERALQILQ